MKFSFFRSNPVATDWNGAASYVQGIVGALHARGHQVTYYEPRLGWGEVPGWDTPRSDVVFYEPTLRAAAAALRRASDCDVLVAAGGSGVLDEFMESAVLDCVRQDTRVVFWDLNPSETLDRLRADWRASFHNVVGAYDAVFTYGGGPSVVERYLRFGARACVPIPDAVEAGLVDDPEARERILTDQTFARRALVVERALERSANVRSVRNAFA